jgi:plasmid stability protein
VGGVTAADPADRSGLAPLADCKQNASMPNVLIRNLPDDVHATLQRRAANAGMSLQQYLSAELSHLARNPTMDEVLDRIRTRSGGRVGLQTAVDDLREERDARDRR